jgi:cytochrome o ubiquinol oxidase subunit 3
MTDATFKYPGVNLGEAHGAAHVKAELVVFGFWVFLMSDLIFFGLMFAIYITMLSATAGGPGPKDLFDLGSLFAQTMILLISSLTFGIASISMKYEAGRGRLMAWLGVTLLLGFAFLFLEIRDFAAMADKGGIPSRSGFLSAFFGLVPLHGLHVASGCLWLIVMLIQIRVFGMSEAVKTRLLRLALFWHFLDVVWIGIFSVVYFGGLLHG